MKFCTVKLSELTRNRMDAGFWCTLDDYKSEITEVKAKFSEEEAREALSEINLNRDYLQDIKLLSRGQQNNSTHDLANAVKEFPLETLAIVIAHKDEIRANTEAEIAEKQRVIDAINNL